MQGKIKYRGRGRACKKGEILTPNTISVYRSVACHWFRFKRYICSWNSFWKLWLTMTEGVRQEISMQFRHFWQSVQKGLFDAKKLSIELRPHKSHYGTSDLQKRALPKRKASLARWPVLVPNNKSVYDTAEIAYMKFAYSIESSLRKICSRFVKNQTLKFTFLV